MAPESIEETERLASLLAAGEDDEALGAWRDIVTFEVQADRLSTEEQAEVATLWIAARATTLATLHAGDQLQDIRREREREIRVKVRSATMASLELPE